MTPPIGLLVMAYGTASGPDDVERYYTDIRGGRPPDPKHLRELKERYAAIGNSFPLLDITAQQAEGVARELNRDGEVEFRPYLGMKHSPPFIPDAVGRMQEDGVERAVGIVMAPHWSAMSVETYIERVEKAVAESGGPAFNFVRHWYDNRGFIRFLEERVAHALAQLDGEDRARAAVIFSAHSLPTRRLEDGTLRCLRCTGCPESCRYRDQLAETGRLVSEGLGVETYTIAWQSAGRTADPWWGPPVEDVIHELAAQGHRAVVLCSAGFVADHLEILYDLDIQAKQLADEAGIAFVRTEMPNVDPGFLRALATVVREHLPEKERA